MPELSPPAATRRIPLAIGAVVIGAAVGFGGIYGFGMLKPKVSGDPACHGAVDLARRIAPLAQGEVAALTMATTRFTFSSGRARGVTAAFWLNPPATYQWRPSGPPVETFGP